MDNPFEKYYDVVYPGANLGHSWTKALREIIVWGMDAKDAEEVRGTKNDQMCNVVLARLDTQLIVAMLRGTFMVRNLIECWHDKVDEAEIILASRGLNPRQILRGLKQFPKD